MAFTQKPYALNFYPHGNGEKRESSPVQLSNPQISLSAFRKVAENAYMVRLINNYKEETTCDCTVFGQSLKLSFGKYEVKTLLYESGVLKEQKSMLNL